MTDAYGYVRVSGLGQVDGDGFPRQLAAIQAYARKHDLNIVRVFQERGVSGTTDHDERPAMREMLGELGAVKVVLIEKLDRLARDVVIQEGIIARFIALHCELVSTVEPDLCSSDPTRVFIRQVLGAVAGLDRALTVSKLRAARERKRANGERCEGRKGFGRDADELATLAMMQDYQREGARSAAIANFLNYHGRKSRSGGKWFPSTVARILKRTQQGALAVLEKRAQSA